MARWLLVRRSRSDGELAFYACWATPRLGCWAPMPRIGEVNLAQLVAEVGPILDHVDTAE